MVQKLSRELSWFQDILQSQFFVQVDMSAVSVEATELGMDEVESWFLPKEVFERLPATLLYELMIYDEDPFTIWLGAIAYYPESPDWCLQVITQNDGLIYRKVIPRPAVDSRPN